MNNEHRAATGPVHDLLDDLYALSVEEIDDRRSEIEGLLNHREIEVRRAAAEALGLAGVGAAALRERLTLEKNDLVLAEVLDSLAALQDTESLPQIYELAQDHPAQLVRTYSVLALQEIESTEDPRGFLENRLRTERSRRVQAAIAYVLVDLGERGALETLTRGLDSKDPIVRVRIASLIKQSPPQYFKEELRQAIRERLSRGDVAEASLEQALEGLEG